MSMSSDFISSWYFFRRAKTQQLHELLTLSPVEVQDIFDVKGEDWPRVPSKTFDDDRSRFTKQVERSKITKSWRDYSEFTSSYGRTPARVIEQVNPLQLGRFYLATGWNWVSWRPLGSDIEGTYRDESLCVVYLLTNSEQKQFFPKETKEFISIVWPARWTVGGAKAMDQVVLKSHEYLGEKKSYSDSERLLKKWKQMIPLWTLFIPTPSLNYPRLSN